jgi:selenide,water dikinase
VGLGSPDDAAVWRLDARRALVVTTDFFTPIVDEPEDFGAIAATNALSDLYAMGAEPFLALNLLAIPADLPAEIAAEILRGGASKVKEAGAILAGGHSVQDREPKYGLVAVGMADPERLLTKSAARPGDVLVLTKPIGTGIVATALKHSHAEEAHIAAAVQSMKQLNRLASRIALENGLRAATDITGFGLLGHGAEMAQESGVGMDLYAGSVPLLPGAEDYARKGEVPSGTLDNDAYFRRRVVFDTRVADWMQLLLFDAQTSGGLLLAVPEDQLPGFLAQAVIEGLPHWPLGVVTSEPGLRVHTGALEDALQDSS